MTSLLDGAQLLLAAHADGARPTSTHWPLRDSADTYKVQDATLAGLGAIGGWKVGTGGPDVVPHCAPLPAQWIVESGSVLPAARYPARLVELEVALRVRTDMHVACEVPTPSELAQCFDALLPAIELVERRLTEGRNASAVARLADLQGHGGLVVGAPSSIAPGAVELRAAKAALWFGDDCAARTTGGNPSQDVLAGNKLPTNTLRWPHAG